MRADLQAAYRLATSLPVRVHHAKPPEDKRKGGRGTASVETERRNAIAKMRRAGMKQKDIAAALSISAAAVSRHCRLLGL